MTGLERRAAHRRGRAGAVCGADRTGPRRDAVGGPSGLRGERRPGIRQADAGRGHQAYRHRRGAGDAVRRARRDAAAVGPEAGGAPARNGRASGRSPAETAPLWAEDRCRARGGSVGGRPEGPHREPGAAPRACRRLPEDRGVAGAEEVREAGEGRPRTMPAPVWQAPHRSELTGRRAIRSARPRSRWTAAGWKWCRMRATRSVHRSPTALHRGPWEGRWHRSSSRVPTRGERPGSDPQAHARTPRGSARVRRSRRKPGWRGHRRSPPTMSPAMQGLLRPRHRRSVRIRSRYADASRAGRRRERRRGRWRLRLRGSHSVLPLHGRSQVWSMTGTCPATIGTDRGDLEGFPCGNAPRNHDFAESGL